MVLLVVMSLYLMCKNDHSNKLLLLRPTCSITAVIMWSLQEYNTQFVCSRLHCSVQINYILFCPILHCSVLLYCCLRSMNISIHNTCSFLFCYLCHLEVACYSLRLNLPFYSFELLRPFPRWYRRTIHPSVLWNVSLLATLLQHFMTVQG